GLHDRYRYGETYTVTRTGLNTFSVARNWQGIQYPAGVGNFPLWESSLLRDKVFRKLFVDWQDGNQQFPELGDPPTFDPQTGRTTPVIFGTFPAFEDEVPQLIAPTTGDLVVNGNQTLGMTVGITGTIEFTNIIGNGDATPDNLVLTVTGGNV